MGQMEGNFGAHGLPGSSKGIDQGFHQAQQHITPSSPQSRVVQTQAAEQGLGEAFQMNSEIKNRAKEQLTTTNEQVFEKKNLLAHQTDDRQKEIGEKLK